MAEENHKTAIYTETTHDDMNVVTALLRTVKGISLTSTPPALETVSVYNNTTSANPDQPAE